MVRARGPRPIPLLGAILLAGWLGSLSPAAWAEPAKVVYPEVPLSPSQALELLPEPVKQWFPGLDSVPGLTEPEQKLARRLEKNPKLIHGPESQAMLEEWREDQKVAQVTATLPWKLGPVSLPLAGVAQLTLPAGFKFVDEQGVATFYQALGKPMPGAASFETRLGMVMTTDQSCLGRLVLLNNGHTDDRQAVPFDEVLAELNNPRGGAAQALDRLQHPDAPFVLPADIRWLLPPVVDSQRHSLTWSRNGDPSLGEYDLFSFVLFGKDSCILIEFPFPPNEKGMAEFRAKLGPLLGSVGFLPGHTYPEHRGPAGPLTLRVLVRGSMTALERDSEALGKIPGASMGTSLWEFLLSQSLRILSCISFCLLAYASWRRHRKARTAKPVNPV